MNSVIVYDFDKTLTYKDTLLGFFMHVGRRKRFYIPRLLLYMLYMVKSKAGMMSNTMLKEKGVNLFLKDLPKDVLDKLGAEYSQNIAMNQLCKGLTFEKTSRYVVVSASFEVYVRPIFPESVTVIGTKLLYRENKVDSLAFNCYKEHKAVALRERGIESVDILYTDSLNDEALARISRQIVIVEQDRLIPCDSLEAFREYFGR